MGRKVKYSKELKLEIVKRYLKGESAAYLGNEYKLPPSYFSFNSYIASI